MARRAQHYCADEVRRLIENLARWPGWNGSASSRSSIDWINDVMLGRRTDEHGPSIPVLGGEAADTQAAIMRMDDTRRECLLIYYTGRGVLELKLHTLNRRRRGRARIGKSAFYAHVDRAHHEFMALYREVRQVAHVVEERNTASSVHAGVSVARRHRLVAPGIGLVVVRAQAKEPAQNQEPACASENGK